MKTYVLQFRYGRDSEWRDDPDYRPFSNFYDAVEYAVKEEAASFQSMQTRVVRRTPDVEVFYFEGEKE